MMTSKIPKDVLLQLQIQKGAKVNWTVSRLRELLNDYISAMEETDQQGHTEASSNVSPARPLTGSTETLVVGQKASQKQDNKIYRFAMATTGVMSVGDTKRRKKENKE